MLAQKKTIVGYLTFRIELINTIQKIHSNKSCSFKAFEHFLTFSFCKFYELYSNKQITEISFLKFCSKIKCLQTVETNFGSTHIQIVRDD